MKYLTSNTAALPWIQVILTVLILAYAALVPQSAAAWTISLLLYAVIGCFGISICYHRLLTHKSFKLAKSLEYLFTWVGCLAFTGSSIGWVGVHRDHHRYSDTPQDPHTPIYQGAKMLIANYGFEPNKWAVKRLIGDSFHRFIHGYYFGLLGVWGLLALAIGGPTALMHWVLIPGCISIWVSTISNYMNHKWGYTNYPSRDNSKNNWLNAIFTFGEGWHNNHHARPGEFNFGHKWWEVDLAALIIKVIKK